jgi:hypothetical protein
MNSAHVQKRNRLGVGEQLSTVLLAVTEMHPGLRQKPRMARF